MCRSRYRGEKIFLWVAPKINLVRYRITVYILYVKEVEGIEDLFECFFSHKDYAAMVEVYFINNATGFVWNYWFLIPFGEK